MSRYEKVLAAHGGSFRIRVMRLEPPRELDIRIDNPIEGAQFGVYRLVSNQEWRQISGFTTIMKAMNTDRRKDIVNISNLVGEITYSLYGMYYSKNMYRGQDMCIGDFETLDKALTVLEGIGLISRIDHRLLLVMSKQMENAR